MRKNKSNAQENFKVVLPLSGGYDGAVLLAKGQAAGYEVYPLFIDYGHISATQELRAARELVQWAQSLRHGGDLVHDLVEQVMPIDDVAHSFVLGNMARQRGTRGSKVAPAYVPNRNAFLLLAAANYAVEVGADRIAVGFHAPLPGGTPMGLDQSAEFMDNFNRLLKSSIEGPHVPLVVAPLIENTKPEILVIGRGLGVPLELCWTCMMVTGDKPCGTCPSCQAAP